MSYQEVMTNAHTL